MKKIAGAALAMVAGGMAYAASVGSPEAFTDRIPVITSLPIFRPIPSPTPGPSPTTPAPAAGSVLSPSLTGLAAVASGLNVQSLLTRAWGTGAVPEAEPGGVEGAFRFLCAPSHNANDDPIVYPGQPGKSHLHTFFGNTQAGANSTYQSLRTTGNSTCNTLLNRSAYWMPAMMNGRGKVVMPDYVQVYYKRPASTSVYCRPPYAGGCLPLPRGLRYVFGYNMTNPAKSSPTSEYWWNCDGPGAKSGMFRTIAAAAAGCPVGARLGAVLRAANCWNGRELDSADHRSHMAYAIYDGVHTLPVCPSTHPYRLPQFTMGAWYTTDATLDRSGGTSATSWYLSSDRMAGMANAVPGTTLHADWFGAWEDSVLALWTANCIDRQLSCSGGDLGNGQQLRTDFGYTFPNFTNLVNPPAS